MQILQDEPRPVAKKSKKSLGNCGLTITWRDIYNAFKGIYDEDDCRSLFAKNKKWLENHIKNTAKSDILEAFIIHIGDENFPPVWR